MIKIFRNIRRRDWALFAGAVALIVFQVFLDLRLPDYMTDITKLIETPGSELHEVLKAGGKMLACALGSLLSAGVTAVIAAKIAADFSAATRKKLYDAVQSFSMAEIHHFSTSSLITRMTNDVNQVQLLITMGMVAIVKAPIMAVWAITKIAGKNAEWTMATGVAVVLLFVIIGIVLWLCVPRFRRIQSLTDDVNRVTREDLTGLKVIRAYNNTDYQTDKFERVNDNLTNNNLYTGHRMALMMPGIQAVLNGLTLAIYALGAVMINNAAMTDKITLFSNMVVFSSYAMQVIMAFMLLVMIYMIYPRASVAAQRILEVTDTQPSVVSGIRTEGAPGQRGEIAFRHVNFRYPDESRDVIHDIDFTAHRGETIALIGATGCGKSTIVNLIPRFYDTTGGQVLVDGVDVRDYAESALNDKIGYVAQSPELFQGTIGTNIAFGETKAGTPNDAAVRQAAQTAEAASFIAENEKGYERYVAQSGANLSGGQRQRVSIARAVARDPEILIFDDAFSALDYKTDRQVRENLRTACADATKIIVAQRIGTIRDADRILVIKDGAIAGSGTHQELMANCEEYQQIALSQLSKEELA
ncbi:ABC transporter ATP-binding protein [Pseudoramibacter porci]|uniref:ABC transporter ATP-binding protein n=1 Tax=Pseudoramibacter porci TaxID=2606631 RepID=A0A7X2TAI2_9FIRM|nr:ABC transporter ATP-binding protein [Pseudoramibacter porci]MSS19526.1 ABC transporter ATP-binding protein [Pseudoramibacter porci]